MDFWSYLLFYLKILFKKYLLMSFKSLYLNEKYWNLLVYWTIFSQPMPTSWSGKICWSECKQLKLCCFPAYIFDHFCILHNFRILAWRIFYINNCNYYLPANNNAVCANLTSILLGLNKRCVVATQNGLAGPFLVINLAIKCRKRANYLWSSIYGESVLIFQGIIKVFTYLLVQYYLDQDISVPLVA